MIVKPHLTWDNGINRRRKAVLESMFGKVITTSDSLTNNKAGAWAHSYLP